MASVFQINKAIEALIDEDTGEILDEEALLRLQLSREAKLEALALLYKDAKILASDIEDEEKALKKRRESAEKKADNIGQLLGLLLNNQKFETPRVKVGFRKSDEVQILDQDLIPEGFMIVKPPKEIPPSPDKAAIKKAIKGGADVPGAALVVKQNIKVV